MMIRMSLYRALCLVLGLCTLSGCVEEYEADIAADDADLLGVEGTICSSGLNRFYLSRTMPVNSSFSPQRGAGATVSVRGSDGSEYMTQGIDGCYTCQMDALSPDVEYYLHIENDGEVYESEPQKPLPTEPIAEVRGVQNTPASNIDVLVTPGAPLVPDHPNYYSWTYEETWEVRPVYTTDVYYDAKTLTCIQKDSLYPERGWMDAASFTIMVGASTNYDGQHIQGLKLYDISRGSERIFYRYSGLVHQRAISKAEYEYELARRQAGAEMGGLFTPLPSALPTNIHCRTSGKRAIGFVGCSLNTSEYRFFLSASDFVIYRPQRKDTRIRLENPTAYDCLRMLNGGMLLSEWEDNRLWGGSLQTAWAWAYQLDVRLLGAYIERPDFW